MSADEKFSKMYDLMREREDKAIERENRRIKEERERHEALLVGITEIKSHIKTCPSKSRIDNVDNKLNDIEEDLREMPRKAELKNVDDEIKRVETDFKSHVTQERWVSIAKEIVRLIGAGFAGLASGSLWGK